MRLTALPKLRLVWALLALVQLSAAVVAPLVDASTGGAGERVVHIESESGSDCAVHHDHLFCQVCRTVALAGRDAARACTLPLPDLAEGPVALASADLPTASPGLSAPLGSRAPPRA